MGAPDLDSKYSLSWNGKRPEHCHLYMPKGARGHVVDGNWTGDPWGPYRPSLAFSKLSPRDKDNLPKVMAAMKECGPMVSASIGKDLDVAVYDLTLFMPFVVPPGYAAPAPSKPKL